MAATFDIEINLEPRTALNVQLGEGQVYALTPPKTALALKMAVRAKTAAGDDTGPLDAVNEWLNAAFGEEVADKLRLRLEDPNDLLDFTHIMKLMEEVLGRENPTGSSPASSDSEELTGGNSTGTVSATGGL